MWGIDFVQIEGVEQALVRNRKGHLLIQIELEDRDIVTRENSQSLGFGSKIAYHAGLHDVIFDSQYDNVDNQYVYMSMILKNDVLSTTGSSCSTHAIIRFR